METIEIQCGSCLQVMGVGVEHLGAQVQCPHCQAVVQTPEPAAFGLQPAAAQQQPIPDLHVNAPEEDSIFASGHGASDDVFGDASAPEPRFQAPPPQRPMTQTRYEEPADPGIGDNGIPGPFISHKPQKSNATLIMFLIMIPYALIMTALIAYLLFSQNRLRYEPFERLPDPRPSEGPQRASILWIGGHDANA